MLDHSNQSTWTVWQWLDEKGWCYVAVENGYQSPDGRKFIASNTLWLYPGDVIHYLKTGYLRNIMIFATTWYQPSPDTLGLKRHKDGTCVAIRRIK